MLLFFINASEFGFFVEDKTKITEEQGIRALYMSYVAPIDGMRGINFDTREEQTIPPGKYHVSTKVILLPERLSRLDFSEKTSFSKRDYTFLSQFFDLPLAIECTTGRTVKKDKVGATPSYMIPLKIPEEYESMFSTTPHISVKAPINIEGQPIIIRTPMFGKWGPAKRDRSRDLNFQDWRKRVKPGYDRLIQCALDGEAADKRIIERLEELLTSCQSDAATASDAYTREQRKSRTLASNLSSLQDTHENLRERSQRAHISSHNLKGTIRELRQEIGSLKAAIQSFEKSGRENKAIIKELQQQLYEAQETIRRLSPPPAIPIETESQNLGEEHVPELHFTESSLTSNLGEEESLPPADQTAVVSEAQNLGDHDKDKGYEGDNGSASPLDKKKSKPRGGSKNPQTSQQQEKPKVTPKSSPCAAKNAAPLSQKKWWYQTCNLGEVDAKEISNLRNYVCGERLSVDMIRTANINAYNTIDASINWRELVKRAIGEGNIDAQIELYEKSKQKIWIKLIENQLYEALYDKFIRQMNTKNTEYLKIIYTKIFDVYKEVHADLYPESLKPTRSETRILLEKLIFNKRIKAYESEPLDKKRSFLKKTAAENYTPAILEYGKLLIRKGTTSEDIQEGARQLEKIRDEEPLANYELGVAYGFGEEFLPEGRKKANQYFRDFIESDHPSLTDPKVQRQLGVILIDSTAEGLPWLEKAAEQNDPQACNCLASIYRSDHDEFPKDLNRSAYYFEKAANIYESLGKIENAVDYYKKADACGSGSACGNLLRLYKKFGNFDLTHEYMEKWLEISRDNLLPLQQEYEAICRDLQTDGENKEKLERLFRIIYDRYQENDFEMYKASFSQTLVESRCGLGHFYSQQGMHDTSVNLLETSAQLGHIDAQYDLAFYFYYIRPGLSIFWARKAAEQGHILAKSYYGMYLLQTAKVDAAQREKGREMLDSISDVNSTASHNLGMFYLQGDDYGLPKDLEMAVKYLKKAAGSGNLGSSELLKTLPQEPENTEESDK